VYGGDGEKSTRLPHADAPDAFRLGVSALGESGLAHAVEKVRHGPIPIGHVLLNPSGRDVRLHLVKLVQGLRQFLGSAGLGEIGQQQDGFGPGNNDLSAVWAPTSKPTRQGKSIVLASSPSLHSYSASQAGIAAMINAGPIGSPS